MTAQTKFIVWDWNGTLLDDTDAVASIAMNVILARVGHGPMDVVSFREWHDLPFEKIYRRAGLTDDEIIQLKTLRENHIFHDNYEPMADLLGLRDGATEILNLLNAGNAHSYILSNHIVEPDPPHSLSGSALINTFRGSPRLCQPRNAVQAYDQRRKVAPLYGG